MTTPHLMQSFVLLWGYLLSLRNRAIYISNAHLLGSNCRKWSTMSKINWTKSAHCKLACTSALCQCTHTVVLRALGLRNASSHGGWDISTATYKHFCYNHHHQLVLRMKLRVVIIIIIIIRLGWHKPSQSCESPYKCHVHIQLRIYL